MEKPWLLLLMLSVICRASCYLIDYQVPYSSGNRNYPKNPILSSYTGNKLPGDYVKTLIGQSTGINARAPANWKSQVDQNIVSKMEPLSRYPEFRQSQPFNYQYFNFEDKKLDSPAASVIQNIRQRG